MVKKKSTNKKSKKDSRASSKGKKKIVRKLSKKIKILKEGSDRPKSDFKGAFGDLPESEGEWVSEEQEAAAVGLKSKKRVSLEDAASEVAAGEEAIRISPEDESSDKNYISGGGNSQVEYARSSGGGAGEYVQNSGDSGGGGEYQVGSGDANSGDGCNRGYEVKDDRNYSTIDNSKEKDKEKDRLKHPWEI